MNWKLILQLSLFGLAMGIGTVFVIPSTIEPLFWLAIFILSAYIIARRVPGKHFLHGFFVSLVNCVWVTGSHILFFNQYIANHPREAAMTPERWRRVNEILDAAWERDGAERSGFLDEACTGDPEL